MQPVICRKDVATAKRELLSALRQKIQVRSASPALASGPPVAACRTAAWVVVQRRPAGGVGKDTAGEVTIHVCVPYRVVGPNGTTIRGLHGVYFSPATARFPKSA